MKVFLIKNYTEVVLNSKYLTSLERVCLTNTKIRILLSETEIKNIGQTFKLQKIGEIKIFILRIVGTTGQ